MAFDYGSGEPGSAMGNGTLAVPAYYLGDQYDNTMPGLNNADLTGFAPGGGFVNNPFDPAAAGAGGQQLPAPIPGYTPPGYGGSVNHYIPGYGYSNSGFHPGYSTGNPMGAVAGMMAGLGYGGFGGDGGGYGGAGGRGGYGGISPGVSRYYENLAWLNQQRSDINEQYNNLGQREQQGLIDRGLNASTIMGTMMSGVQRERTAALARLPVAYGGGAGGFTSMSQSGGGGGGWAASAGGGSPAALGRLHAAGMSSYGGWKGY